MKNHPALRRTSILALSAAVFAGTARAVPPPPSAPAWPARTFAPYAYLTGPQPFSVSAYQRATGQRYFVLAFIVAGADGQPAWDGTTPVGDGHYYAGDVARLRQAGGDVCVSFGGEGGSELALKTGDAPALAKQYQGVVDAYQLKRVDFDIEGPALDDAASVARRNRALVAVRAARPDVAVSFTLPVAPQGMLDNAVALLKDAAAAGVRVSAVNLMTMDYGPGRPKQPEGQLAIGSVQAAHAQLQAIFGPAGCPQWICPMIGKNDVKGEQFTPADAAAVRGFADAHDWVTGLTFWSADRDHPNPDGHGGGDPSATYTQAFAGFTGPAAATTRPAAGR